MFRSRRLLAAALLVSAWFAADATAQPLGTFRWQLQPFCNVVTVAVTQNGAVYRLEGTDDQCGNGADAASVTGTAFPNADGTIGFGLNIVTTPGGRPLHVDADIAIGTFSGTWRDSAGATGTFVFTPGAGIGGNPRPLPSAVPSTIVLGLDGGFVAGGAQGVGVIPASGSGNRMMWYPAKAAFRAGESVGDGWDDANIGYGSVAVGNGTNARGISSTAMGMDATASGTTSTAMGNATQARGVASTAMGDNTIASGSSSTAMGNSTTAEGPISFAIGSRTIARGSTSTAMGSSTTADGPNSLASGSSTVASGGASTALGSSTVASGSNALAGGVSSVASGTHALAFGVSARAIGTTSVALGTRAVADQGSFVFADGTSALSFGSGLNQFFVRASGGFAFFSNPTSTTGVQLVAGGSQWLSLSDVRTKHRFRELDGDDILARIARMPVTEWSYLAQDDAIRHIGPTAQDFHAAFGLGEDPLRIGTLDADGVALAGVKALEARSRAQEERIAALERQLADALAALCAATNTCR
jgi:hypothetical protein